MFTYIPIPLLFSLSLSLSLSLLPLPLDYSLLSVMLTGRALSSHKKFFGSSPNSSSLTKDDWSAIRDTFSRFDEVMSILRLLPTSMILVLRNINIVRSINRELGSPVNRFNIMSKRWVK